MTSLLLWRTVRLGPVDVVLCTDEPAIITYLANFYSITDDTVEEDSWTVDMRLGNGKGWWRNPWGVRYQVWEDERVLSLRADSVADLAMTARKVVREALIEYCEQRRYAMLHASAWAIDDRVVLVVGDKGSGKTTLALRAVLEHGARLLSNDHLIVYLERSSAPACHRLVVTSLPTPIPVKIGTYLDVEDRLPEPWDDEGLNIDAFRTMSVAERYRHDRRLLYTYRQLGQDNPIQVPFGTVDTGPEVMVVLARYAAPDQQATVPERVSNPTAAVWPHVRSDWPFDQSLNTQHLPRTARTPAAYVADTEHLVAALVNRAEVVFWDHIGDPRPLVGARL